MKQCPRRKRLSSGSDIAIHGNDDEGLANGVYTFLRTLMIENQTHCQCYVQIFAY